MGRRAIAAAVGAALLALGAGGGLWWRHQDAEHEADRQSRAAAEVFARAWSSRELAEAPITFAGSSPAAVAQDFAAVTSGLKATAVSATVSQLSREGQRATGRLDVSWVLPSKVEWSYQAPLELTEAEGRWAVQPPTSGSLWHPQLAPGDRLLATRVAGARGDLLDRHGRALMPFGTVYPVQLDPARATAASAAGLERVIGEPEGSLVAKLAAAQRAKSQAPIPVITYRESDFTPRRAALDALPGVIYPPRKQPLAPSRTFGQPLLGSFGPVTAEVVAKSKGRYAAGDLAGLSGLLAQYDEVLADAPGIRVVSTAQPGRPLFEKAAAHGTDVALTLDPHAQQAAEAALARTGDVPSALVAVDVPSGDLVAVANSPAFGFDRALTGRYPPGSALKVATAYALLTKTDITPQTPAPCPQSHVVNGMPVRNYEGESLPDADFAADFAHSCNTAFVQLAAELGDDDVAEAAKALGVGAGWEGQIGVANVFAGSVPPANGATDKAASAIGQGRNLVSPAALAVMAGSVARGAYVPPALVTSPAPEGLSRTAAPLEADAAATLQDLMALVVTEGTAPVLRGTPGGQVHGKTGTAEHGTKTPPETHAWFVGYQGDVAFAVLVEQGKSGGMVAAPVARDFLARLAVR
jgi:cell division protein FtsI/penicillin-binding protein 2